MPLAPHPVTTGSAVRASGRVKPLAVVAAIFLPPLGVFLDRGIGKMFWISCLLTLIAFVPGMIFALYLTLISPAA